MPPLIPSVIFLGVFKTYISLAELIKLTNLFDFIFEYNNKKFYDLKEVEYMNYTC